MAKKGIDSFPLDCTLNDKIKLIEYEFGLIGFAIVVKLFQKIYREQGYYCEWNSDVALVFASEDCKVGANVVSEIVSAVLRREIFDKDKYEKYHILTSKRVQEVYIHATKKRDFVEIIDDYILLNDDFFTRKGTENIKKVSLFSKKGGTFEQSKVNKRKVKKSKENINKDTHFIRTLFINITLNDKSDYPIYVDQQCDFKCRV